MLILTKYKSRYYMEIGSIMQMNFENLTQVKLRELMVIFSWQKYAHLSLISRGKIDVANYSWEVIQNVIYFQSDRV